MSETTSLEFKKFTMWYKH